MENLKSELKVYKNWIFNDMPIQGIDVHMLCTYVEAFRIPFKFGSEKLISYNKNVWKLYLRNEEDEEVTTLVNAGVENTAEVLGRFPSSFLMVPNKFKNYSLFYPFDKTNPMPIGVFTGQYYYDIYGYCWFEMNGHFMPDKNQIVWVRETAIDYEGKEEMQTLISEKRMLIQQMRANTENKNKKSKLLTYLTLGLTLLQSR